MKKGLALVFSLMLLLTGCTGAEPEVSGNHIEGTQICLSDKQITVDGQAITDDETQAVYGAKDIIFYEAGKDFTYGAGEKADEHTQEEADAHTVVHIAKPGRYVLSGKLSLGQIAVDLGEDAEDDPTAVVTLILNGVDITCQVAPAVIFYRVYECCESDEETATKDVDTSKAGANVVIADDTENNITGSYVAKIYKSYELSEDGTEVVDSKKLHKYDGAFYSKKTMNIDCGEKGNGILNIFAENEGLDSELHLTVNGGVINITSGNDGINTNEDNVSVTTVNGGQLNILCDGSTGEGDGIDSNGWLVINGGKVTSYACSTSGDAGIDSDKGIYINGGQLVASGNMLDHISGGEQNYVVFQFGSRQNGGGAYTLKNADGEAVGTYAPANAFTYLIVSGPELEAGAYTFWQADTQLSGVRSTMREGGMPQMPQDGNMPQMPQSGNMPQMPQDGNMPQMPQDGNMPQMPQDGNIPQMPQDGNMPPVLGEMKDRWNFTDPAGLESSVTFQISDGGNQFIQVGPAA